MQLEQLRQSLSHIVAIFDDQNCTPARRTLRFGRRLRRTRHTVDVLGYMTAVEPFARIVRGWSYPIQTPVTSFGV